MSESFSWPFYVLAFAAGGVVIYCLCRALRKPAPATQATQADVELPQNARVDITEWIDFDGRVRPMPLPHSAARTPPAQEPQQLQAASTHLSGYDVQQQARRIVACYELTHPQRWADGGDTGDEED